MKRIILTFGLVLTGLALFGQSPRIRLNQITKDSLTGSVVLSGSDSNMVYSRDFFLNLTDSVLILFGDTLSTTATAFTGVATDLTLTGNGTVGNELKVDTAKIATVSALADSLAGIISSVTTDLTLTGDGSVATPLKVDTSVIATIKAISDSLAALSFATNQDISDSLATLSFATLQDITDTLNLNTRDYITGLRLTDTLNLNSRGFLTQNQTITLTDDATGTGTTSISVTVVNDSHNHTISTLTGIQDSLNSKAALVHTHTISDVAFLQDSLDAKANDADLNNYLLTANYIVDSTRINATGDTAYYYQNGVLIGTGAIAGGGGGGSGTVTDITAGTFLSGGTITTSGTIALDTASAGLKTYISDNKGTVNLASGVTGTLPVANGGTGATTLTSGAFLKGNGTSAVSGSSNLTETADTVFVSKFLNVDTATLYIQADSNRVGIGTSSPTSTFQVNSFVDSNDVSRKILFGNSILYPARQGFIEFGGTHNFNVVNSSYMYFTPTFNLKLGSFFPFGFVPDVNLESNVDYYYNFLSIISLKNTNGFTLSNYENAFYRNDFYATTGAVTNSTTFKIVSPYFATGSAIKPTNQYGITINNQGASGITTSYGLYIDSQSGSTNNYALYIGGGTVEIDGLAESVQTALYINANGVVSKGTSSLRYKTDIKDYNKGLDYLMKLNPVWFTYKSSGQTNAGFIAEQIYESGLEEFVTFTDDGQIEGLKGEYLKPLIVKAIQEQQAIIETQQAEIEILKTQIQNILTEINNLKNN